MKYAVDYHSLDNEIRYGNHVGWDDCQQWDFFKLCPSVTWAHGFASGRCGKSFTDNPYACLMPFEDESEGYRNFCEWQAGWYAAVNKQGSPKKHPDYENI